MQTYIAMYKIYLSRIDFDRGVHPYIQALARDNHPVDIIVTRVVCVIVNEQLEHGIPFDL